MKFLCTWYFPFWSTGVRMNWFTAQFSSFRWNPIANEKEVDWSMLWLKAKMQKLQSNEWSASYGRTAWQKLSFHLRNYLAGFSRIDEVLSHLLWIKSIQKEELEPTIKNYHPKHHNSCTANYGCNMLAQG